MAQSVARQFYEQFASEGVDIDASVKLVRQLIGTKFEDDTFDAKQEPSGKDENDRKQNLAKMWSEILCGFANAGGGVIIWGLVAKSDPIAKKNKVRREHPVRDPARLEAELRSLQGELTDPPLGNVEHRVLNAGAGGFVVSFIPDGPLKPYRQRHENGNYYYRWGDSFRVMPRHMLQAMFYPRSRAVFRVEVELSWVPQTPPGPMRYLNKEARLHIGVKLANVGNATAKDVMLDIACQPDWRNDCEYAYGLGWSEKGPFKGTVPLHPRMPAGLVTRWQRPITLSDFPGVGYVHPDGPNLIFTFTVFCDNHEPQRFEALVDVETMDEANHTYTVEALPGRQVIE